MAFLLRGSTPRRERRRAAHAAGSIEGPSGPPVGAYRQMSSRSIAFAPSAIRRPLAEWIAHPSKLCFDSTQ